MDEKEWKKHCHTLNIDLRNGPHGKKQVWKKKREKTKEHFLAKYFMSESLGTGRFLHARSSFSAILWIRMQPHLCVFFWFNVP